jgi:hypothetical protein
MRFNNEAQRLQHAQAGLVPSSLWDDVAYFNSFLDEQLIPLMTAGNDDELQARLTAFPCDTATVQQRKCAWMASFLSHRDFSGEELYRVGNRLRLSNQDLFECAASTGSLSLMRYMEEHVADQLQGMIAGGHFLAFTLAAKSGHLGVIQYLKQKITPEQLQAMSARRGLEAFLFAAFNHHYPVVQELLTDPRVFAHAEQHVREYQERYISPFIQTRITELRAQKERFSLEHPTEVFEVRDPEEARLHFYVLRHLIRNQDFASVRDNFLLLIDIPAVKALLHTEVTPGRPNELVRLALSSGNIDAAAELLNIPDVRRLTQPGDYVINHDAIPDGRHVAQAQGFYREEQRVGADVAQLAQDRESSMTALTQGEQERLSSLSRRYASLLKAAGVDEVMNHLRQELEERYEARPATIITQDPLTNAKATIELPVSWAEFEAIQLNKETKKLALKAYYQNQDHTALRYLSIPNHWMHRNASYVNINNEHTERWADFELHQPLIALFYLAAGDEEIGECNGYNNQTRLECFIKELALLGRAHNWDDNRNIHDRNEALRTEECDDMEADRPSCYSGVKRRLFQSVLGHPEMMFLTLEHIKQDLNEYMRAHFKERITKDNREILKAAWDKTIYAEDLNDAEASAIQRLNVSPEEQAAFISKLGEKYGAQFESDQSFASYIQNMLRGDAPHLHTFGYLKPDQFMVESSEAPRASALLQHGLFARSRSTEARETLENTPTAPSVR